jgi:hypothetical protein
VFDELNCVLQHGVYIIAAQQLHADGFSFALTPTHRQHLPVPLNSHQTAFISHHCKIFTGN